MAFVALWGTSPGTASAAAIEPLSYYLPVHDAKVSITRTTQFSASYAVVSTFYGDMVKLPLPEGSPTDPLAPLGRCLWAVQEKETEAKSELSLVPRPDAALGPIPISTASSSWVDFESSVSLSPEGFLAGVNVASEGRGPQVIQSVLAAAGRLLAFGVGAGVQAFDESPETAALEAKPDDLLKTPIDEVLACEKRFVDPAVKIQGAVERATQLGALGPNPCNPFDAAFLKLPDRERWVLGSTSAACRAFLEVEPAAKAVATAFGDLDAARAVPPAPDLSAERARKLSIERLVARYDQAVTQLAALQKSLAQLVAEKLSAVKLAGSASKSEDLLLPIDGLCAPAHFQATPLTRADGAWDPGSCSAPAPDEASAMGLACRCARGYLAQKGAALLAEATPAVAQSLAPELPGVPAIDASGKRQSFLFRQPVPMTFRLVSVDEDGKPKIGKAQTLLTLHPRSKPRGLSLELKAMNKGSVAISLSPLGVPTTVKVSRTSSAAGWAGAIAEGTKSLRDEYKATVEALVTIEEKQRELQLSDLSDEVARLKKEKEVLDQSVALDVAEGSYESLVARQKLENDLALLESQLKMKVAQDTLDLRATTQTLAAELARVVQELELVKKRLELAEAQAKK